MKLDILLVEDQLAQLVADVLGQFNGFSFTVAATGVEALRLARSRRFDLILMDIRLPAMDGLTALRLIREFDQKTPVIVLTAYADNHTKRRALANGASDFFAKPFDYQRLARRIVELTTPHEPAALTVGERQKLIRQRRLEELKLQKTLMGISTPPEIKIEIEDLEREIQDRQ